MCFNTDYSRIIVKQEYSTNFDTIPKIIHMTYHNKSKIPQKVYDNLKKYASDYTIYIYDDNDVINFLNTYFTSDVVNKFNSLKGAHKADLFRYCVIYQIGGIYMDIKTELIMPISDIFKENYVYTVLSNYSTNTIYQGIIASKPKNPFFLRLINYVIQTPTIFTRLYYMIFTVDFYREIQLQIKRKPKPGINNEFYLFEENCDKNSNDLDRYGLNCNIYDKGRRIIKVRFSDYPWK